MEIQSRVYRRLPRRRVWWVLQLPCAADRRGGVHTPGQCSRCPKVDCRVSASESPSCSCWQFSTTRSWEDVSATQNARTVRGQVRACPGKSTAMTTHTASLAGRKEVLLADVKPECLPLSGKHSEAPKSKSSLRRESRPCAQVDIPRTPVGFPPGCSSRTGRARPRVRQMVRRPSQGVWRQSSLSQ